MCHLHESVVPKLAATTSLHTPTSHSQMGVESLLSFHVHVRFNGKYFGRFSLQEEWSKDALEVRQYKG